ncbi:hypothetical protein ACQJBY_026977 [Aegilops geniculata]
MSASTISCMSCKRLMAHIYCWMHHPLTILPFAPRKFKYRNNQSVSTHRFCHSSTWRDHRQLMVSIGRTLALARGCLQGLVEVAITSCRGMGIYDAMKFCKADISTVCFGLAASMGAFLLAAGTKGKRFCMPNARIMIHQPSGGAGGKATEMGLQITEMLYEKIKINKIMSRITGKPEEQIDEDTKFDCFMSPWEAKDYGIIDSIIDGGKLGLVAPVSGAVPPPKSRVWYLWNASGPTRKIMKNLPSEEKLIRNGNGSVSGADGMLKEASST